MSVSELEAGTVVENDLRASSYVIYVDLPNHDDWLLLHGYTGAYDRVSSKVAAYVRSREITRSPKPLFGEWSEDFDVGSAAIAPSDDTIGVLRKRGYLTEKSAEDELKLFNKLVAAIHKQNSQSPPHYVIMPTYDCNLRCSYCFQDHFRTNASYGHLLRPMSIQMADRIMSSFDGLERQYHGQPNPGLRTFTFFGGEPLLAASRGVVEHIIRKQQTLGCTDFGAVTNGTELPAFEDLLGPGGLKWLQITLDGPPEKHDKRRIRADGGGSFEAIAKNIDLALSRQVEVAIRVNVDRANHTDLPILAMMFAERNWTENPHFSTYLAPVHDYSGSGKAGERADFFNTWELGEMLKQLHAESPPSKVFRRVDGALRARARNAFRSKGSSSPKATFCGAHNGMYLFDPLGDIYACWDRTGDDNLKMGVLREDGVAIMNPVFDMWRSRTVTSNPTCSQCRFALNCGGGCAVLAEVSSGTINSNYCDVFGKRFRAAVAEEFISFISSGLVTVRDEANALREELLA